MAPAGLRYATVHKTRKKGRVVDVATRVIFGTAASVQAALARSAVSRTVNTAFVERHNGTARNRDAQEGAEDVLLLEGLVELISEVGVVLFTTYSSNFCWPVRTLKTEAGEARTPAMMAKLTDHVWTLMEWIKRPAVRFAF